MPDFGRPNPGAPNRGAVQIAVVDFASHRVQQRRVPQSAAYIRSPEQITQRAKTSPIVLRDQLLRKSSSAISGFRSLLGREQHSSSYCAQFNLLLEPFTRRALASRTLASPASFLRGPATQDRCCARNVVAPGEYSKGFFCVRNGLYRADLWPATARGMPARSLLGAVAGVNPALVIKVSIDSLWPRPASTTRKPPGANRRAAWGISVR